MREEGQDGSSDPSQFAGMGMTKSWKELVENIPPLLPDDENVSATWHHGAKPASFPCGSSGFTFQTGLGRSNDTGEFLQRPQISKAGRV